MDAKLKDRGTMFQNTAAVKVFQIDMIREEILKYAINNDNGKLSPTNVTNVRLVQKSWLETTTKLLRKSDQSIIELTLTKDNSRSTADDVKTKGKMLDRFFERFLKSSRMKQSFLPFKLILKLEYFHEENYQSLMDCFNRLGNELVELDMTYPIDGGTMPLRTFSQLRKLTFRFSDNVLQKQARQTSFGDNETGFWLLQSILSGCKDLRKLNISFSDGSDDLVPKSIEFLRLPNTISTLTLGFKLKSKELGALIFQLSNLKHLTIFTHSIPLDTGLLFNIFERFQKSLTRFHVVGPSNNGFPYPHTYLRFPFMENLEWLVIDSLQCSLGPWNLSTLQNNLPALHFVELTYQTEAMITKWFQNLNCRNVDMLSIAVVDDTLDYENDNFYKSISLEMMTQVHTRFPNLGILTLDLNISNLTVLTYLFENMNYLRILRINVQGNWKENGTIRLDSIFLGLPIEVINAMRFLETFVLKNDRQPWLRNLSELTSLILWTYADTDGEHISLLSDLLFTQGFLNMTKLRRLYFFGSFKPSPKMQKEWNDRGGQMKYATKE